MNNCLEGVTGVSTALVFNRISKEWLEDYWNTVLCCSACDFFGNPFALGPEVACPESAEEFLALRDRIFIERKRTILASHEEELAFFDSRPEMVFSPTSP